MKRILFSAGFLLATSGGYAQTVIDARLQVQTVVTGLSSPTTMAFIGPNDFLVLQKGNGHVRWVRDGVLQAVPVLDVAVNASSERGLLGIATDPDFQNNGRVYLFYTESATDGGSPFGNRVYSYRWNGTNLVEPRLVLDLPVTPGPNHDGGILTFGPDDKLYAVIGDLNRNGKLQNFPNGPDPDDTGVILRMNTDGSGPSDNPFFDRVNPGNPMNRYFAYGVRNSYGMAFDPATGLLWNTENGPSSYDEIDLVERGFNSGWEQLMGPDARDPQGEGDLWVVPGSKYSDPVFSWSSPVAPTALAFVGSRKLGCALERTMIVGDNNCGQLYRFRLNGSRRALVFTSPELQDLVADNGMSRCSAEQAEIVFGSSFGIITDLKNGPDGRLYVVSYSRGAVYRLAPAPGQVPDADGDEVDDACDCDPTDATAFAAPVEVPRVRVSGADPTTLGWDAQGVGTGSGTRYAVVTGLLSDLRMQNGFAAACTLGSSLAAARLADARDNPPTGEGHYYLVKAENGCFSGTFGNGTPVPDPRDVLDAGPLPPACTP